MGTAYRLSCLSGARLPDSMKAERHGPLGHGIGIGILNKRNKGEEISLVQVQVEALIQTSRTKAERKREMGMGCTPTLLMHLLHLCLLLSRELSINIRHIICMHTRHEVPL